MTKRLTKWSWSGGIYKQETMISAKNLDAQNKPRKKNVDYKQGTTTTRTIRWSWLGEIDKKAITMNTQT
jgi:hypothetical protein